MQKSLVEIRSDNVECASSKSLHLQMLLSLEELKNLFQEMGHPILFLNGKVLSEEELKDEKEQFFSTYEKYIESLPTDREVPLPAAILSQTERSVYAFDRGNGRFLLKARAPAIQIREHRFITTHDGRYISMGFGKESVRWGIQFSFPQLVLEGGKIVDVLKSDLYENVPLFRTLQQWVRSYTRPATFQVEGKKKNCTFRVGLLMKESLNNHHDLQKHRIGL